MVDNFNKIIGVIFFITGFFLLFKNNLDLDYQAFIMLITLFISTFSTIFFPIIFPNKIKKIPLINLINLYFLICYLGVFFFD